MIRNLFFSRKIVICAGLLLMAALLAGHSVSPAADGFPIITTPTTEVSRLPMVQDSSSNSDMLVLSNFSGTEASATISLRNTAGELTAVTVSVGAYQVQFVDISEVSLTPGIYSLKVEARADIHCMVLTGPSDFHSITTRKLIRGVLPTEARVMYLPMMANFQWARGDLYLANFAGGAAVVTISVYESTGASPTQREITVNANSVLLITADELIGTGREGIFNIVVSAPGTVLGVYTITDPDNDKSYYPLVGEEVVPPRTL